MSEQVSVYESKMKKTLASLESELMTIRAGRANPNILNTLTDHIICESHQYLHHQSVISFHSSSLYLFSINMLHSQYSTITQSVETLFQKFHCS